MLDWFAGVVGGGVAGIIETCGLVLDCMCFRFLAAIVGVVVVYVSGCGCGLGICW